MKKIAPTILLSVISCFAISADAGKPPHHPKLGSYCADVRKLSALAFVDMTQLPESADFSLPIPTEVLGQKVLTLSRRTGLEGTLLLGLVVTAEGKTKDIQVLESSGHQRLDNEAVSMFQGAVFSPACLNKKPVAACNALKITFKLVEEHAATHLKPTEQMLAQLGSLCAAAAPTESQK